MLKYVFNIDFYLRRSRACVSAASLIRPIGLHVRKSTKYTFSICLSVDVSAIVPTCAI